MILWLHFLWNVNVFFFVLWKPASKTNCNFLARILQPSVYTEAWKFKIYKLQILDETQIGKNVLLHFVYMYFLCIKGKLPYKSCTKKSGTFSGKNQENWEKPGKLRKTRKYQKKPESLIEKFPEFDKIKSWTRVI